MLGEQVPAARPVAGRGDAMPLPDHSVDAVLASSSWHWMDVVPTLHEIAWVLTPGGTLAAVWSGPDPEAPFLVQAMEVMKPGGSSSNGALATGDGRRDRAAAERAAHPRRSAFRPARAGDIPLRALHSTADDIIGLLGTISWVITMSEDQRERIFRATRLMKDL